MDIQKNDPLKYCNWKTTVQKDYPTPNTALLASDSQLGLHIKSKVEGRVEGVGGLVRRSAKKAGSQGRILTLWKVPSDYFLTQYRPKNIYNSTRIQLNSEEHS